MTILDQFKQPTAIFRPANGHLRAVTIKIPANDYLRSASDHLRLAKNHL